MKQINIAYICGQFDALQAGDVINVKELLTNSWWLIILILNAIIDFSIMYSYMTVALLWNEGFACQHSIIFKLNF